ncbi:glycosyltransferase [Candidatus Woesebacteria bacterium]|nr:glycosyltransferase [Candidatus Woesebacteria bacterium]
MSAPTVSITLATYNRTEFLQETLDSLVAQTYQDFEIILVDDGSTDETPQYIEQLLKKKKYAKVRFLPLSQNKGIAFAISYAMQHAKGTYISHIGSDDLWHETALEKMVQVLDSNPEVGVVYTDAARIDKDGNIISESRFAENPIGPQKGWIFKELLLRVCLSRLFR